MERHARQDQRDAKKSILIEQQYIRGKTGRASPNCSEAIKDARKAAGKLDIRIILGKTFSKHLISPRKRKI